ncbi:MAG TPA: ATP-binding protein, partial [Thermoanaerobaculaceae bacterium]|nr:ATP-binding protein [Thermoanaerobaculaceae bacterium]
MMQRRDPPRSAQPLGWVRSGIALAAVGYTVVFLHALFFLPWDAYGRLTELATALLTSVAFALTPRRQRLAATLTLGAVWLECSFTMSFGVGGLRSASALVYPVLAVAAGLMVGSMAALGFAAATGALLVGVATLRQSWAPDQFGSTTHWVLVAVLTTLGGAVLGRAARRSYGLLLKESELERQRYAHLFESAPDGLVALDQTSRIAMANAKAAVLLGASSETLIGIPFETALLQAGATGAVDLDAAARPGAPLLLVLSSVEGTPRSLEISARAGEAAAADGRSLVVLRDVTQRRLVEERLGHAQRLEMIGQLAGGVAHDFNNLLTAVAGNATLLAEHADPGVRELAEEIQGARRSGSALTQQLLAFARRDVHRSEALDLAEVVSGTSRLLTRLLGEHHLLALDATQATPVLADRAQLEQVLLNLVGNARDAMPDGGTVSVQIRTLDQADAAALGSSLAASRQALLEVADTGTGMSPEVQARIFEPFFTTKPRGRGTGLGLATVHGIAAQSGGQVAVESSPGKGARFRVFLPAGEDLHSAAPAVGEGAAPGGGERVLLVEDDPSVRSLVERLLSRAGYKVAACADSDQALAAADQEPRLDLLVSDIGMPGRNGPELAALLRRTRPALPVLFISGYPLNAESVQEAPENQLDVLQKPFEPSEFLRRVRKALERAPRAGVD